MADLLLNNFAVVPTHYRIFVAKPVVTVMNFEFEFIFTPNYGKLYGLGVQIFS